MSASAAQAYRGVALRVPGEVLTPAEACRVRWIKREPDTYVRLAIAMNAPTAKVAFLSDVEAELDAAAAAGMRTCQIHRPDAGGPRAERHPVAADFAAAAALLGLPAA